jgi:hypothetical protein
MLQQEKPQGSSGPDAADKGWLSHVRPYAGTFLSFCLRSNLTDAFLLLRLTGTRVST